MNDERLNTHVGLVLLPLLAAAIVAVLWLGQRPLRPTMGLMAEFDRVGQLQVGAKVMIANVVVGRVTGIGFHDRREPGQPTRRVRVYFYVERRYAKQVYASSPAYVSSISLIGERHLELDAPEEQASRAVRQGDVLKGHSPAHFDRLFNLGYESLVATSALTDALAPHWKKVRKRFDDVQREIQLLEAHRRRVEALGDRIDALLQEARKIYRELQAATDDFRAFEAVGKGLEKLGQRAKAGTIPLVADVERLIDRLEELARVMRKRVPAALDIIKARSDSISQRFHKVERWLALVERAISRGDGTIGAFLKEKELFDDFKVSGKIIRQEIWRTIARPRKTSVQGSPALP